MFEYKWLLTQLNDFAKFLPKKITMNTMKLI